MLFDNHREEFWFIYEQKLCAAIHFYGVDADHSNIQTHIYRYHFIELIFCLFFFFCILIQLEVLI